MSLQGRRTLGGQQNWFKDDRPSEERKVTLDATWCIVLRLR